jgi:hypothetical protein
LKQAQANSSQDPISKNPSQKRAGGVAQCVNPEFKPQYQKKKKKKKKEFEASLGYTERPRREGGGGERDRLFDTHSSPFLIDGQEAFNIWQHSTLDCFCLLLQISTNLYYDAEQREGGQET